MRFLRSRLDDARRRPDNGAVLVEFALVLPVIALLAIGLLEYGSAFREKALVERSVQQAARTAASTANGRYADYDALRTLDSVLSGAKRGEIERVIVYNATGRTDGSVPGVCLGITPSGGGSGSTNRCNVYSAAQVAQGNPVGFPTNAAGTSCAGGWDSSWCPIGRRRSAPAVDRVGVYVEFRYEPLTGLLPSTGELIKANAVYQLEPSYSTS